jgi:mono/diheme cytochrome c family protein
MEVAVVAKFTRPAAYGVAITALVLLSPLSVAGDDERPVNPYAGHEDIVPEGKSLFNQYCAHCHGPDAVQGERPRDLRRLRIRYGDDAIAVFYKTVSTGRPEKGMPVWKGVLKDDTLWKIFTFLSSVQTQP